MNCNFSSFVKGVGTGAIIGMAAYAAGSSMINNNKHAKKRIGNAAKSVGNILESVSDILR